MIPLTLFFTFSLPTIFAALSFLLFVTTSLLRTHSHTPDLSRHLRRFSRSNARPPLSHIVGVDGACSLSEEVSRTHTNARAAYFVSRARVQRVIKIYSARERRALKINFASCRVDLLLLDVTHTLLRHEHFLLRQSSSPTNECGKTSEAIVDSGDPLTFAPTLLPSYANYFVIQSRRFVDTSGARARH